MHSELSCRFCGQPLRHTFIDLGVSPLANSYVPAAAIDEPEPFYPLHARVCSRCFLVQLPAVQTREHIFRDYAYFSSWSASWLEHARRYAEDARRRFRLGPGSMVLEVASNDGYLLQYFRQAGVPVLGVEPAANVARTAAARDIETIVDFFGTDLATRLAAERGTADLIVGNNVLAHVPDLNDFVSALGIMLAPGGTVTLEFPHLLRLIAGRQFDTIYHEHFSYFSLGTARRIFEAHGLELYDVEELPTHGGSLRVYLRHAAGAESERSERVETVLQAEAAFGLKRLATYGEFAEQVRSTKRDLLSFLIQAKQAGQSIVGYGAPAKGNTLLNYCGIGRDFLDYTVDRNPEKQGTYLPGSRIPVFAPDRIGETRPDYVLVLAWNLLEEISGSMAGIREWGGRFVVPIPEVRVC